MELLVILLVFHDFLLNWTFAIRVGLPSNLTLVSSVIDDELQRLNRFTRGTDPDALLGDSTKLTSSKESASNVCANKRAGETCNFTHARVCTAQGLCVSACEFHGYHECNCANKDEYHCYLCCGRNDRVCRPAHDYGIYKYNGERWERQTCKRCRSAELLDGQQCDDKDRTRVCMNGMCVRGVCQGRPDGQSCNFDRTKVCVEGECEDPCRRIRTDLRMCDCPRNSVHQCHLCCQDWKQQKCVSAYYKYGLKYRDEDRPIFRLGLTCGRFDHSCNRFGECAGCAATLSLALLLVCLLSLTALQQSPQVS